MPGPTCQSQMPLKRCPVAGLTRAPTARPHAGSPTSAVVGHVRRPARPYPLRAWAPKQSLISSPLRSTALAMFSPLYLPPSASVPSVEHCHWKLLLSTHAPPCHPRLGVRSPSRPPLGADRTLPLHAISLQPTTHHRGEHYSGEILSSHHPKLEPPWPGLGPRPIPHRSSATGRPNFATDRRRRERAKRSPVLHCRMAQYDFFLFHSVYSF
jgi:hypothetical protein